MEICCMTQGDQIRALWQLGWDGVGTEKEVQEGGDVCIPSVDSCWYMAETNTIL